MMRRVLFVNDMPLAHLRRGTPICLHHLLREIRKYHELTICANNVSDEFEDIFIQYPKCNLWGRIAFLKKVIQERNIDTVFTGTEINIKLPIILKIITGVKIAIDLHGLYNEELYFAGKISWFKKQWLNFEVYSFLLFYDRIFTVSKKLSNHYNLLKRRRVVIYGGLDIADFPEKPFSEPDVFTIGYMGNPRPYQGLDELLEAAHSLKIKSEFPFSINLILSETNEHVQSKIADLDLKEETTLIVNVPQKEAFAEILKSSVLVIPRPKIKVTDYAFPSKLPEFLYTGHPTILTNVGPVSEFEGIERFAEVIPSVNIHENLTSSLVKMKTLGKEARERMGKHARMFVSNELTWQKIGLKASRALDF
jgi:glycosyltransferase involved in cell wall biosynthesis